MDSRRIIFPLGAALTGMLAGNCLGADTFQPASPPAPDDPQRPNILWLTFEDTSPYDFGCYGNTVVKTPVIDSLAANGLQYMNAWSVGPQSSPSRSTLITGCYCSTYGMDWHRARYATPAGIFFPEYLRRAGYFCTNNSKTDYNTTADNAAIWDQSNATAGYNSPKRAPGQPFFAVYNTMMTHMSRLTSYHLDGRRNFALEGLDPATLPLPEHVPDLPQVRSDFAFHLEGAQDVDRWVKLFLDDLKDKGLADNTIVFIFSDHGGCLPRGKGFAFDTGMRVPLVVWLPEKWKHLAPDLPGMRQERVVGFVDMAPTVLSLAGVAPPGYMEGQAFLGKYAQPAKRYEFGVKCNQASHYVPERSVTDGRLTYIRRYIPYKQNALMNPFQWGMPSNLAWDDYYLSGGRPGGVYAQPFECKDAEQLFDYASDPYQTRNLIDDPRYAADVQRLRAEVLAFVRRTRDLGFFPRFMRSNKVSLYDKVRRENYDFEKLFNLVELTAAVEASDVPMLAGYLVSPQPELRFWAAVNFAQLASAGLITQAPAALIRLLDDPETEIACQAAYGLCCLDKRAEAIEFLTTGLDGQKLSALEVLSLDERGKQMLLSAPGAMARLRDLASKPVAGSEEDGDAEGASGSLGARKVLVNLGEIRGLDLWNNAFYDKGLQVNTVRKPMKPAP